MKNVRCYKPTTFKYKYWRADNEEDGHTVLLSSLQGTFNMQVKEVLCENEYDSALGWKMSWQKYDDDCMLTAPQPQCVDSKETNANGCNVNQNLNPQPQQCIHCKADCMIKKIGDNVINKLIKDLNKQTKQPSETSLLLTKLRGNSKKPCGFGKFKKPHGRSLDGECGWGTHLFDLNNNISLSKDQEKIQCVDGQWMLNDEVLENLACNQKCKYNDDPYWEAGEYLTHKKACRKNYKVLSDSTQSRVYNDNEIICGPDGEWYHEQQTIVPACPNKNAVKQ